VRFESVRFVGRGLGGEGTLSLSVPGAVQQGYAPVVGIAVPNREGAS